MKILLVTDNHFADAGGAEKYFFELKNRLQTKTSHEVMSLGLQKKAFQNTDTVVIKQKPPSKFKRFLWSVFPHPIKYFQIKKVINHFKPDIIHFHNLRLQTASFLKAAKDYPNLQTTHDFSGICPTSGNIHNDFSICENGFEKTCWHKHRLYHRFITYFAMIISFVVRRKLLKKHIDLFISPSPFLTSYLLKKQFPASYLPPFINQVNPANFEKIQANHFLYLGQLGTHKGVEQLIDEFALACQKNKNLLRKIAGKGSQAKYLKQKVKNLNLEKNILFLGWQTPEDLYAECSALIFPSIWLEAFGLVITEAMSHSRAIIGTKRGPTAWLIDDKKTGLLYDPLQKGDLAEKLLTFAANPNLAKEYGTKAKEKLKAFPDDEEIIANLLQIYTEVIAKKKGAKGTPLAFKDKLTSS